MTGKLTRENPLARLKKAQEAAAQLPSLAGPAPAQAPDGVGEGGAEVARVDSPAAGAVLEQPAPEGDGPAVSVPADQPPASGPAPVRPSRKRREEPVQAPQRVRENIKSFPLTTEQLEDLTRLTLEVSMAMGKITSMSEVARRVIDLGLAQVKKKGIEALLKKEDK